MATDPIQESTATSSSTEHAAEAGKSGPNAGVNQNTHISSLADLKEKAPKVYEQMMLGIAMTVTKDMQKSQNRLKNLMREAQRDNQR